MSTLGHKLFAAGRGTPYVASCAPWTLQGRVLRPATASSRPAALRLASCRGRPGPLRSEKGAVPAPPAVQAVQAAGTAKLAAEQLAARAWVGRLQQALAAALGGLPGLASLGVYFICFALITARLAAVRSRLLQVEPPLPAADGTGAEREYALQKKARWDYWCWRIAQWVVGLVLVETAASYLLGSSLTTTFGYIYSAAVGLLASKFDEYEDAKLSFGRG